MSLLSTKKKLYSLPSYNNQLFNNLYNLLNITDFQIVNGQRRYQIIRVNQQGQKIIQWCSIFNLRSYLKEILQFQTLNNSLIEQKQLIFIDSLKSSKKQISHLSKGSTTSSQYLSPSRSTILTRNQARNIQQISSFCRNNLSHRSLKFHISQNQLDNYDISKTSSPQERCFGNIFTDQSQSIDSQSQQLSFYSEQTSLVLNRSTIKEFIQFKLKEIQRTTQKIQRQNNAHLRRNLNQTQHINFMKIQSINKSFYPYQSSQAPNLFGSISFLQTTIDNFQRNLPNFVLSIQQDLPQDFQDYVSLLILSSEQIYYSKPNITHIIKLYALSFGYFFAVNTGNFYIQHERFIQYNLLKQYNAQLIFSWLILSNK